MRQVLSLASSSTRLPTKPAKLLAVDIATTTGWALGPLGSKPGSGAVSLKTRYALIERCKALELFIKEKIKEGATHFIREEAPNSAWGGAKTNFRTIQMLNALCVTADNTAHTNNLVILDPVKINSLKLSWTGQGNAPKELMVRSAKLRGFLVSDHNEADALALWHWGEGILRPRQMEIPA
jgi:hypothetical protein